MKQVPGALFMHPMQENQENPFSKTLARLAHTAVLMEAGASPKPGLVCPDHNGAHKDMNHALFVVSADSLLPYFEECAAIGQAEYTKPPETTFPLLRMAGIHAEKTMFAATGNVNTHKGTIFSMGLAIAATGRLKAQNHPLLPEDIAREAAAFVRGIVTRDLALLKETSPDRPLTAGETLYLKHGVAGIRQEAENGFPSALGAYERLRYTYTDLPLEKALPQTLLWILAKTEDTNILWRGGMEGLAYARASAAEALELGGVTTKEGQEHVLAMRDEFTARNLSPGGSADILALAAFFLLLYQYEQNRACCNSGQQKH